MSQLTTHILNTSTGKPAAGVAVLLYQQINDGWLHMVNGTTNTDGRIPNLLANEMVLTPGIYKLHFDTAGYFQLTATAHFYPFVEIVFSITGSEHYHVPLLLNPFGYSTYRGS